MAGELCIARSAWAAIVAHARRDAPLECCGLLVGAGRNVAHAVAAANRDASRVRYTIDPHDYLNASREARALGLDVIGAYHSHPTSPPRPSATDLAEGVDAPFIYIIVGPVDARCRSRSSRLGEGRRRVRRTLAAGRSRRGRMTIRPESGT